MHLPVAGSTARQYSIVTVFVMVIMMCPPE